MFLASAICLCNACRFRFFISSSSSILTPSKNPEDEDRETLADLAAWSSLWLGESLLGDFLWGDFRERRFSVLIRCEAGRGFVKELGVVDRAGAYPCLLWTTGLLLLFANNFGLCATGFAGRDIGLGSLDREEVDIVLLLCS